MCIAFKPKVKREQLPPVYLNGDILPWKESVNHLGATLHTDGKMDLDINQKRGIFISTNYNLNQEFDFCTPEVRLRMLKIYNMHFTNCRLWSFQSESFDKLCRSYNKNLKILYNLPFNCHNWIIKELSGGKHAWQQMISRYVKFVESLCKHESSAVSSLLFNLKDNVQLLVGSNLCAIHLETGVTVIPGITKFADIADHRVYKYEEKDIWKVKLLCSLMEIRDQRCEILFDEEEGTGSLLPDDITAMIDNVATSWSRGGGWCWGGLGLSPHSIIILLLT